MTAGVYIIHCDATKRSYCGSSKHVAARLKAHKSQLRSGKHVCEAMLKDYQFHGERSFHFLHLYEIADEEEYLKAEKALINSLWKAGDCYNANSRGELDEGPEIPTMTPEELKLIVEAWGGIEKFAKLIDAKERTVKAWLYGERNIKPPIAKLIRSLKPKRKETTP